MGFARRLGALLVGGLLLAAPSGSVAETRCAVLEVFLRGEAERSQQARTFIEKTYAGRKGVVLAFRDVTAKDSDLDRFWKLADHFKIDQPGLPAFYVSGRFEFGWDPATSPARLEEALTVEIFVRQGCSRCASARPVLFNQLAPRYPGYRFVERDLVQSAEARQRLQDLSNRYRVQAASVPAVHLAGKLVVGFYDAATSFRQWDDVLKSVTIVCPAEKSTSVRSGQIDHPRGGLQAVPAAASIGPFPLISVAAWAQEPPAPRTETAETSEPPAPETLSPEPWAPPPLPAELPAADVASIEPRDAPPPRPVRTLPPEVPAESEPLPLPESDSTATPADVVVLPLLGEVHWRAWGLPAFTLTVGLIDGFNPCAMWVLLFLLSLLVNLQDRWKILTVAGTFVAISGLAYYAFMAAWLQVAQWFALLRPVQILLGLLGVCIGSIHVKDFFAFKKGLSLSIPESAKPTIYERTRRIVHAETLLSALVGAIVLAVLVNFLELLCTAGLPAMYTSILTLQQLPAWQNHLYLLLYIAAYMFDDSLMVAVVVITLGKHKLQERGGRILKLISGSVILALGLVLLFRPQWLEM